MLQLENLEWRHPPYHMHFNLHAAAGERLAILGASGAGKSTLLNLIAGFLPPQHGRLLIDGTDYTAAPPAARPISMLYQEHNLFSHLSVRDNIAIGINPNLKLTAEQRARLHETAEKTGLADLLGRLPEQLSGGQKQRVALARCLLRDRPLLLLDEPFSALDPALRFEMLDLLDDTCLRQQPLLLMVTHNLDDALRIAPRSLVIDDGTIAWDGTTADLARGDSPAAALLGIGKAAGG